MSLRISATVLVSCVSVALLTGAIANPQAARTKPDVATSPVVVEKARAVLALASDGRRLVAWEAGPLENASLGPPVLLERNLVGGAVHRLAAQVDPSGGLAVTAHWVVYGGGARRLLAVTHDASRRAVLSTALVAPIAARGAVVAWAEQMGNSQRIVARNLDTGRTLLSFMMPRCEHGSCYQLEQVELSTGGVVFTRDGANPDRSFVIRVRFPDRAVTRFEVKNDPQPDLVPSSSGAVFYAVGLGWLRWDFGWPRPRPIPFAARPPTLLLAHEGRFWFVAPRRGCTSTVVAIAGGESRLVVSARDVRRFVSASDSPCADLRAYAWTDHRLLTAWAVLPEVSEENHVDVGLVGLGFISGRLV